MKIKIIDSSICESCRNKKCSFIGATENVFCKTFLEKNAELFGEFCISKLEKIAEVPVGHFLPTGYQCRHS